MSDALAVSDTEELTEKLEDTVSLGLAVSDTAEEIVSGTTRTVSEARPASDTAVAKITDADVREGPVPQAN